MMNYGFAKYLVVKAYQFELKAIESEEYTKRNPFYDVIKALQNGDKVWEVVDKLVEDHYQ